MALTASTGTFITILQATAMWGSWASNQATAQLTVNSANPKGFGFGSEKLIDILDQTDCIGIRIYNGINGSGKNLIIIGVDSSGDDMAAGLILDMSQVCPPDCGINSIL